MSAFMNMLTIQLPQFEGPLGLLLYLIRKEEMDIMDIQVHKITTQYLEYIKLMKELDLELAGEFVSMAATLLQIKSRMLLPQYNEDGEVVESEDPRRELVQRLLEYQKYQEAGKALYERPLLGRDVWVRGVRERLAAKEEDIVLEENALFSLITAYRKALRSAKKKIHQVTAKLQSIASRIMEIKDRLLVGQKVAMSDLITNFENRRKQVLITFLSGLELGKMGFVSLFQTEVYQEIYFEARMPIEAAHISRVEEYDNFKSEEVAEVMIEESEAILALHPEDNAPISQILDEDHQQIFRGDEYQATAAADEKIGDEAEAEMATDEEIEQALQGLKDDGAEEHHSAHLQDKEQLV